MNLSDGKYLGHEICAFSDNWLIVYDGKYNYYLFNSTNGIIKERYSKCRMPANWPLRINKDGSVHGACKTTEFYSTFDCAVKNLCKCVANDGFLTKSRLIK